MITLENFDRAKPRYRVFALEDGSKSWHTVELDNTPGRKLTKEEAEDINERVSRSSWRDAFWAAFEENKKATVYAIKVDDYVVPGGCTAALMCACIYKPPGGGGTIARGFIYGDRLNRWPDGRMIYTSLIQAGPDKDQIIHTRNNIYKLEFAPL